MSEQDFWTIPGSPQDPIYMVEGEIITYSVSFESGTVSAVTSVTVYKDDVDYSSTAMPSGSNSYSAGTVTWKPLNAIANTGGEVYIVVTKATVDGNTEVRKSYVQIIADESES